MLSVRPVTLSDVDAVLGLKRLAGPGFTSLAVGDDIIAAKIKRSVDSFTSAPVQMGDKAYMLVLEDSESGRICGMSQVKAEIGVKEPFFNFKILNVAQNSKVADRRFDIEVLLLVNEYAGASEVGTLFVPKDMRGTGAGSLISQARYMLIATERERFGERIVSELRGHVDDNGNSPFWDAIGRKFFQMDFNQADQYSAEHDSQFMLDLMPKYPIYANLLPKTAQDVMGEVHPAGIGAKRFLEKEGFVYDRVIDIFDGGPSMNVHRDNIRTVKDSQRLTVSTARLTGDGEQSGLVSNERFGVFRSVFTQFSIKDEAVSLSDEALAVLELNDGDTLRVWIKK